MKKVIAASKRSKTSDDGEYSIPTNLKTPDSGGSTIPHPIGRDKIKKKKKKLLSCELFHFGDEQVHFGDEQVHFDEQVHIDEQYQLRQIKTYKE
ncbi:hypothetical protein ACS0TY_033941 [Phlomoides rotata]